MIDTQKYCRIQGRDVAYRTGRPVGAFAAEWRMIRADVFSEADGAAFRAIEKWFVENLPEPPFYADDAPGKLIPFFKTNAARQMLEKLLPVIALFDKYDYAYDVVFTNHVGTVVYEDDYQVAVLGERPKRIDGRNRKWNACWPGD